MSSIPEVTKPRHTPRRRFGFTLIELLVVVSIIALLVSILLPALSKARQQAKQVICQAHIKQMFIAETAYSLDNRDRFTGSWFGLHPNNIFSTEVRNEVTNEYEGINFGPLFPLYIDSAKLFFCPGTMKGLADEFGTSDPDKLFGSSQDGGHHRQGYIYYGYPLDSSINGGTIDALDDAALINSIHAVAPTERLVYSINKWTATYYHGTRPHTLKFYTGELDRTVMLSCAAYDIIKAGELTEDGFQGPDNAAEFYGTWRYTGHYPKIGGLIGTNVMLMDGHVSWVPREYLSYRSGGPGMWRPHFLAVENCY